jgi:hypothetical protein
MNFRDLDQHEYELLHSILNIFYKLDEIKAWHFISVSTELNFRRLGFFE